MRWVVPLVLSAAVAAEPEPASIRVDAGRVVNRVSPLMYGSCIEDVNHEIYGGLYAQMIFGESFEEEPRVVVPGWSRYGGHWSLRDGMCSVAADEGGKLVWDETALTDGVVECDVRLADDKGDSAGLIVRVQDPRNGADAFLGYEITVGARTRFVRFGRHRNDWRHVKDVPAAIEPGRWHHLRVELTGARARVFLDGGKEPLLTYTDTEAPILGGKVGLRTWQADASFRNLSVESVGGRHVAKLVSIDDEGAGVSGMWDPIRTGNAAARFSLDERQPHSTQSRSRKIEILPHCEGTAGVANRGLNRWGLAFHPGRAYAGRLYLRQASYAGRVTVALQSADGRHTYASQSLGPVGKNWGRHDFSLRADADDADARFALWIDGPGAVWVDQVYLSGTGEELFHGLPFRGDVSRALVDEGLTLLRYGGSMVNAPEYRWKNMIGDPDRRPQYRGTWYLHSTNGFGIEEFVRFCREAGFEPVVAINIEETPQDAADLVEYLNGPATSKWGRQRAKNGHEKPYGVRYIEIGNEETTDLHYLERFKVLHDSMHARDPSVELIIGAWWQSNNPVSRQIVRELDGKAALWDVHVGGDDLREGSNVDAAVRLYGQQLVREWAAGTRLKACILEENGGQHNLRRALGHARILNATQRHGDFVLMDCPANCLQPWKQNDNDWDQGQLFLTSDRVWGMPPYYAQRMAAANHLPCRVASDVRVPATTSTSPPRGVRTVRHSSSRSSTSVPGPTAVQFASITSGRWTAAAMCGRCGGKLQEINTPQEPERVRPERSVVDGTAERFDHEFPAYSYTIVRLKRK